jgi:hypothetical protein
MGDSEQAEQSTPRCAIEWGCCPDHGATVQSSGGRSWCKVTNCGRTWEGNRVAQPCEEPATRTIRDATGEEISVCEGHARAWWDASNDRPRDLTAAELRELERSRAELEARCTCGQSPCPYAHKAARNPTSGWCGPDGVVHRLVDR